MPICSGSSCARTKTIAQKRSLAALGWGMLATLSYYGAYAWIVWRAVGGLITLGDMTLYLGIFRGSQNLFESVFYGLSDLYENGLFMSNLFAFLELVPQMVVASQPVAVPDQIRAGHRVPRRLVSLPRPGGLGADATSTSPSARARRSRWWVRTARARPR